MRSQLLWYTTRSTGIVSWALLSTSVLWGLVLSTRALGRRPRPSWVLDLHRFVGGASAIFVAVHVVSIVLDSYVHFGVVDVLVPLASSWHPGAVAWGIVGLYLLLTVEITSLMRKRLSKRVWHAVHLSSFALYVVATVHLLTAGTDRHNALLQWSVITVTALVGFLTFLRILGEGRRPSGREVGATTQHIPSAL